MTFAIGYRDSWLGLPPASDDPEYLTGYDEGVQDRKASDARGGPVNATLRNYRPGPRPTWSPTPRPEEPQEIVEATG